MNTSTLKKYADALERIAWTFLQATSATALVELYEHYLAPLTGASIPGVWRPVIIVALTVLISAAKNVAATNNPKGNGSASTLPAPLEPIPAQAVQGELAPGVDRELQDDPDAPSDSDAADR